MNYFTENDLFCSAYLPGCSTVTSLHSVIIRWSNYFDQGKTNGSCSLGLVKAFDTMSHNILLSKLHLYSFSELVYIGFIFISLKEPNRSKWVIISRSLFL